MTRNRNKINQAAISVRKQTITQATAGEMTALTMMGGVALISVSIGIWSTLTFFGVLAGEGPVGLITEFIKAVTGL
ncbi:MAG: hypothetical protein JRJ37_08430 [Deltaproteobacteria bacterium]|nr:hypothetical protein [Deltaproteobacteria bacterium]